MKDLVAGCRNWGGGLSAVSENGVQCSGVENGAQRWNPPPPPKMGRRAVSENGALGQTPKCGVCD